MHTHKHHIIPRHEWRQRFNDFVGFDDVDNIVFLSTEQHSQVHRLLFEQNGSEFDRIASECLGGQIGKDEAIRRASYIAHKGIPLSPETKNKIGQSHKGKKHNRLHVERQRLSHLGKKRTDEQRKRISIGRKKCCFSLSIEHKQNIKMGMKLIKEQLSLAKKKVVMCPHCGTSGSGPMYRWHFNNCKQRGM